MVQYSPFKFEEAMLSASLQLERMRLGKPYDVEKFSSARSALLEYSSSNTRPFGTLEGIILVVSELLERSEDSLTEEDILNSFSESAQGLQAAEAGECVPPEQHGKLLKFLLLLQQHITPLSVGRRRLAAAV